MGLGSPPARAATMRASVGVISGLSDTSRLDGAANGELLGIEVAEAREHLEAHGRGS